MLGGLAEALLGAVQFFFQIGPPSFAVGRFLRAYGTFGQPNPYGGYLAMVLPLAVAMLWTSLPRLATLARRPARGRCCWPAYALLIAGATAAGLGMSLSRGAWMGATAGLLALLMSGGRRSLLTVLVGLFLGSLVALIGAFDLLPGVGGRAGGLDHDLLRRLRRARGHADVGELGGRGAHGALAGRLVHVRGHALVRARRRQYAGPRTRTTTCRAGPTRSATRTTTT